MAGLSLSNKILYWVEEEGIVHETNEQIAERFGVAYSNYVSNKIAELDRKGKIVCEMRHVKGVGYRRVIKSPSVVDG